MGQSNVWFADSAESLGTVKRVRALIAGKPVPRSSQGKSSTDPDHNAKVEKAAVATVRRYYVQLGYFVESVDKDNVGWDLEATSGKVKLKIEVKGLSGPAPTAQLTPNEYEAFSGEDPAYRLAIVTRAIAQPELLLCRYSADTNRWLVEGSRDGHAEVETKTGAIIRCRI